MSTTTPTPTPTPAPTPAPTHTPTPTTTNTNQKGPLNKNTYTIPEGASPLYKKFPKRDIPDNFKPTAAVVGAGIAGIHTAWELSRLGFKVTVYDQFRHAGEGATKFDSGLVVNPKKMMHPQMASRILGTGGASESESESDNSNSNSDNTSNNDNVAAVATGQERDQEKYYSSSKYFTYQPLIWRFNATRAYLKSLVPLFYSGTTPLVANETPMGGVFRESWRAWSGMRKKIKPNEKTLITHATELQESTSSLIDEIIAAEPERFGKLVIAEEKLSSSSLLANNNSNNSQNKEEVGWRVIDSSRWCRTMADILEKEYGVKFRYSNMVTRLQWRVDDITEWVSSVVNTDMNSKKVYASAADLTVIAAGSMSILQRDNKANEGYKLPLLSVAGFGLDVPISMLGESAKNVLLRSATGSGSLDSLMPYQLSDSQFLKVMPTPPSAPVPLRKVGSVEKEDGQQVPVWERVEPSEPRLRISGLFSLLGDDVKRNVQPRPSSCLNVLSPRINKFDENAANKEQADLLKAASEGLTKMAAEYAIDEPSAGVSGFRFVRGYTSDGLPLISKLGNAKNAFVVCGFGDDASLLAPGSAKFLADMIMKKKPMTVEEGNPFSLDRFYKYDYLMKYDDNFDTFQEKWYKGENWMEAFGQPILDRLWDDFWKKGPGSILMNGEEKDPDYGHSKQQ